MSLRAEGMAISYQNGIVRAVEADEDIKAGRARVFDSVEELMKDLKAGIAREEWFRQ